MCYVYPPCFVLFYSFLLGSLVAQMVNNLLCNAGELGLIPWRREWLPTPIFSPGESHGQRSLACYSPWGRKDLDMTE